MSEPISPTNPNKPNLILVSSQTTEEIKANQRAEFDNLLVQTLFADHYSDQYLQKRLDTLKSGPLSYTTITDYDPDQQPIHILKTVFDDLHISETPRHKEAIDNLITQATDCLDEASQNEDDLISLREQIGNALYDDYPETNLVRFLELMRQDQHNKSDGLVPAYRLAGLMLILANKDQ